MKPNQELPTAASEQKMPDEPHSWHNAVDLERYKVINWKRFPVLHWILNPGLAVNELLFGQRVPRMFLMARMPVDDPNLQALYPCPHCETVHTHGVYKDKPAQNWFGLYCPACGGIIPCLWNATSVIILLATVPLWIWFYKPLKRTWLERQPARYQPRDEDEDEDKKAPQPSLRWWPFLFGGLLWGVSYYFIMAYCRGFYDYRMFLISLATGLAWGAGMKLTFAWLQAKKSHKP